MPYDGRQLKCKRNEGSGCGAAGKADTRDPQFESSRWKYYLLSAKVN